MSLDERLRDLKNDVDYLCMIEVLNSQDKLKLFIEYVISQLDVMEGIKGAMSNTNKANINKIFIKENVVDVNIDATSFKDFKVVIIVTMDYMTREPIKKCGNGYNQDDSSSNDYDLNKNDPFKCTFRDSSKDDDILFKKYIKSIYEEGNTSCTSNQEKVN